MAAALMRTRDAIVGTEQVAAQAGANGNLTIGDRLRRLMPEFRHSVLVSELMEDIAFSAQDYPSADNRATARSVTVLLRKAGNATRPGTLTRITRPEIAQLQAAVPMVGTYAELRSDRLAEILVQQEYLIPFFASIIPLSPERTPAVIEMLEVGLSVVTPVVMRIKLALGCPRPTQFSPLVQPPIPEPAHPSLPSGHATQAFTLATMLTLLTDPAGGAKGDSQPYRLASRIAINRTVAGVHFPVDSAAGAILGIQLGRYMMARGLQRPTAQPPVPATVPSVEFDGSKFRVGTGPRDFHYGVLAEMLKNGDDSTTTGTAFDVRPAPLWESLCQHAAQEWKDRWS
ncbi:phosphatase PAP2 family protein [Paracoccus sediminis]|uniref:phosphatase PAP2 family protein n=1 Tax=Paracoccus sediminis TaxID=1214787 RepID=UPI0013EEFCEB|nr:phosphatase PAP2 family protein [Paracoccus sediminis]